MADERKIFPVEAVLELISGKDGADVSKISTYILGTPVDCGPCAKALAPFAQAWVLRWFPRALDLEWQEGETWQNYLAQGRLLLGDYVSLTPMTGRIKALTEQVLTELQDTNASLARQTAAAQQLEKQATQVAPLKNRADAVQKKCGQLEAQVKSLKAELAQAQRQAAQFQGKTAVDEEGLAEIIKNGIKDALKGMAIGAAAAAIPEAQAETQTVLDTEEPGFGFGSQSHDSGGFGF